MVRRSQSRAETQLQVVAELQGTVLPKDLTDSALNDELLGYGVWLREGEKGSIANMQRMLFDTTYSFMKLPRGICLPFIANMTAYIPQVNPLISPTLLQSPALWVNPPQWAHVLGVSAQTSHIRDDSAPNASRTNHIKSHDYVL